jgi:hypothetical protein
MIELLGLNGKIVNLCLLLMEKGIQSYEMVFGLQYYYDGMKDESPREILRINYKFEIEGNIQHSKHVHTLLGLKYMSYLDLWELVHPLLRLEYADDSDSDDDMGVDYESYFDHISDYFNNDLQ